MDKITLKTNGKHYNELIEKREEQLVKLATLEKHEDQADEAYEQAYQQYMSVIRDDSAVLNSQLVEHFADANEKLKQAVERCSELADETGRTFIAIVAELIHDNIDVLDGMDINSKQVFLAINEALPDDIFVDTNMSDCNAVLSVHGGSRSMRTRAELQRIDHGTHILCCGKQDHFISKERFLADYEDGEYGDTAQ